MFSDRLMNDLRFFYDFVFRLSDLSIDFDVGVTAGLERDTGLHIGRPVAGERGEQKLAMLPPFPHFPLRRRRLSRFSGRH